MSSSTLLVLVAQLFVRSSVAADPPKWWEGGDWVMESLVATPDLIGVKGEWADYAHTLAWPDYEEDKRKLTTPRKPFTDLTEPDDWIPLGPTDVPYLAVVYRRDDGPSDAFKIRFPGEPDTGDSHIEPTTACGGAILTPRYVLTVCGCVFSLVVDIYKIPPIFHTDSKLYPGYNIYDYNVYQQKALYVGRASGEFVADFQHVIDPDPSKWGGPVLNCQEEIHFAKTVGREIEEKSVFVNVGMVILPFSPSINPTVPEFFPKWPPHPIHRDNDQNFKRYVHLISIGMRQSRPGKFEFFSSISPSSILLQHCACDTFVCNKTRIRQLGSKTTCFKGHMKYYKLSGGVIGWPILGYNGTLVGLTSSERDPRDGTVLSTVMRPELISAIEKFIGKDVLINQNTPAPPFRSRQVPKKFQIYDYLDALRRHPKSGCTNNTSAYLLILLCTPWISFS